MSIAAVLLLLLADTIHTGHRVATWRRGLVAGLVLVAGGTFVLWRYPLQAIEKACAAMLLVLVPYALALSVTRRALALRPFVAVAAVAWGWLQERMPMALPVSLVLTWYLVRLEHLLQPRRPSRGWVLGALGAVAVFYVALVGITWLGQTRLLYPAPSLTADELRSAAEAVAAEEVHLVAADGTRIYAWWLPANQSRGAVILFGGNGSATGRHTKTVAWLREEGWDVLQPNYRGYPGSDGSPTERGIIEDAHAAWEYARTRDDDPWVVGISMGGGVAIALAAEVSPRALVTQSTFTSVREVASHRFPILPVSMLLRDPWDSAARAPEVECPVLLVHGTGDTVVPYSHHAPLARAFARDVDMVTVEGAGHGDLFHVPAVRRAVRQTVGW